MNKKNLENGKTRFSKIDFKSKDGIKMLLIFAFIIIVVFVFIKGTINRKHNKVCNGIKDEILQITDSYLESNNLYPKLNGEAITLELSNMTDTVTFKKKTVEGSVTYTKYGNEYVKTFNLANASYCTTKGFNKKTSNYNEVQNMKVEVLFNYQEVTHYNSKWTKWYPSNKISENETNGVNLPIDSKNLPTIPDTAVIKEYVRDTKTYYSYRDKKWKWYKYNVNYSGFSATAPKGYPNKDTSTLLKTEASEWSLDYPEEFSYRHIQTKKGYQWYKMDGKTKVYWENGKYSVEKPGDEYTKEKGNGVNMYSYYDDTYRWYNKDKRGYLTYFSSTKPHDYKYRDDSLYTYTSWSSFSDTSKVDSSNKSYREEKTDIYSRYLIKYDMYSFKVFDKPVTLEELESKLGKSYEKIVNDDSIELEVTFNFYKEK